MVFTALAVFDSGGYEIGSYKTRINWHIKSHYTTHTELPVVLSQIEMSNNNLYIFEFLTP